jgi:hypothetical protein
LWIINQIVSQQMIQFLGVDVHSPTLLDQGFLCKYQAGSRECMLSLHKDVNLLMVIIALNTDSQGVDRFMSSKTHRVEV